MDQPSAALEMQARGEVLLAPPTFVTLLDLLDCRSVAEVIATAEPRSYVTAVAVDADGVRHCVWSGDAAYESGDLTAQGPRHRLAMIAEGAWNYVNTTTTSSTSA